MKYRLALCFVILLTLPIVFSTAVYADDITITKKQITKVADFTLDNKANAGGTITKGYYVFPDTKGPHGGPGVIKVVDRNTCKSTSSVKIGSVYLSGLFLLPGGFNPNQTCFKTNDTSISQQKIA